MTIVIDWWVVPLVISILISLLWFLAYVNNPGGDYEFGFVVGWLVSIIGIMGAWLVYFLLLAVLH